MRRLSKKFYIISFSIIIILGIIAGVLLVTKKDKNQNLDYKYDYNTSKSFKVNDLTDKQKEIAGLPTEGKLEDKRLYTDEYNKYMDATEEEKAKSEVIPQKYKVPFEKIDDINEELDKKETNIVIPEQELDPETNLPIKFNLADIIDIKVEDQKNYGLCWDFASMKSLETHCALNNLGNFDFSEIHLDYLESNLMYGDREIHDGGNFNVFQKYINEFGVVTEESAPYREHSENEYNSFTDIPKLIEVTETVEFPYMHKADSEIAIEEYQNKEKEFRKTIKEHIMKNGGLYCAIVATSGINLYIPPDSNEFWPNHAVTIVGWDDHYSKDNFTNWNNGNTPKNDGAYIALNSWGEYRNQNGYFYISYEDKFAETNMCGIVSTKLEDTISLSSINNPAIRNYLEEKYGHLLIENDGKKYITKAILNSISELDLSGRGLTSIRGIDIFENAYYIDLSNNNITDLSSLDNMKSLAHLNLTNNNLKNINSLPIENLPNLSYIDLRDNKIKNISSLANLKYEYWITIDVSGNKGITGLESFANRNIGDIELIAKNCDLNTIPDLSSATNIYSLNLANNNISSGLNNLPTKICSLNIGNNKIEDVTELANKTLGNLNIENNNVSLLPKFKMYPGSFELNISGNPISNWDFIEEMEIDKSADEFNRRTNRDGKLFYILPNSR